MTEQIQLTAAQRRAITCNYRTLDQLAAKARDLLASGPRTKTNLVIMISTNSRRMGEVLDVLLAQGLVETFQAQSDRGRMDDFWCLAGQRPQKTTRFNSAEILEGFRRAAFGLPST